MSAIGIPSFERQERARQIAFRQSSSTFSAAAKRDGCHAGRRRPFLIPAEHWAENLYPGIRQQAAAYFGHHAIVWHRMRHHLLSSQICCLNVLMPFATRADALNDLLRPLLGPDIEVLPFPGEGPSGADWYVAFEWIGPDVLNEGSGAAKTRRRGANCTSADAAVRFRRGSRTETLLIEWKYTERYGQAPTPKSEPTRLAHYQNLAFAPDGPVRRVEGVNLRDLLHEPFYQFLRQQMLAFHTPRTGANDCERARVLHIAPSCNTAFQAVTAPALRGRGVAAVEVWKGMLAQPEDFVSATTAGVFGAFDAGRHPALREWRSYVGERYGSLLAETAA
ncbi:hypothetical protein ABAZ39_13055 [Azospirillum argentinense]|uniref:Uncharacterized protein n=1 Tax=Azospirillum argentinense TaxID=2970906 RepID=A0A060DJG1_9PROT|nr:hypothetical protein [Azospirillum argentinense]AIB12900.1 hypothetical protein ABAZ39_13055 [Azospirillum argentinense]EZQ09645.1 hypothetical protein ABAZ39_14465 [Azospirillum argentinense]